MDPDVVGATRRVPRDSDRTNQPAPRHAKAQHPHLNPSEFLTMDRREFFKHTAAAGAGSFLARRRPRLRPLAPHRLPMKRSASRASASAARETATPTTPASTARSSPCATSTANVLDKMGKKYPKAKKYFDYRKMLEELGDKIDAVTVSTPDHTHAPASVMAMRMGKHCFCQKPLTWSVEEARLMRTLAAEKKLCTQMGNQGTAENGFREGVELIRSGILGPIKEIYVWTNRPIWPQGISRPKDTPGVPNKFRWYEFLGAAHDRPYHPDYQPFNWRGWLDFGTGALGDMACHTINIAAMALELFDPESVEVVDTSGIVDHESYPVWSIIRTRFGQRNGRGPLTLTWFDGGDKLPEDKRSYKEHLHGEKAPESGLLLVGEKGSFFSENDYGAEHIAASQGQIQGGREAQADPAALAGPFQRMGRRHQGRRSDARRCPTSTTPAG